MKLSLSRKVATVALAGTAVLGGSLAYAYPPGTAIAITSVQQAPGEDGEGTRFTVNIAQAKPGCRIVVKAGDSDARAFTSSGGTATAVLDVDNVNGRVRIIVRTRGCGSNESAARTVTLRRPVVDVPMERNVNKSFRANAIRFPAHTPITFVASTEDGVPPITKTKTSTGAGSAVVSFKLPVEGTWTIVASGGGVSGSDDIDIVTP
jgi:hypothetical protein